MLISVFDRVKNIVGKGEIACTNNFSFSHNVFKRLLSQTRQKGSLCGNGFKYVYFSDQHLDKASLQRKRTAWATSVGHERISKDEINQRYINCLPNDKYLDWSKLRAFADDTVNVIAKLKFVFG